MWNSICMLKKMQLLEIMFVLSSLEHWMLLHKPEIDI